MSQEAWEQHFFQFLDDKIDDTTRAAFLQSGVLSDETIGLAGLAADVFELDISNADRVMDGFGHIMDLSKYLTAIGVSELASFFENALGVPYYVGIRYQNRPYDVERNPRSSEPEYPWFQDLIGEKGPPDSVSDFSTYIRLVINGILESGVDHSRRTAVVCLNNPVSPDDSIAYFTGTVSYGGSTNYIDIPYSPGAGPLGQTSPEFPISTDELDYTVFIPGVSWFRNTDISTDDNYAFIGTVTGAGAGNTPTVFDITGQRPTFLISLDRAYRANSTDDPAPGRTIFADKKAVRVKQAAASSGAEDWLNEALRVDQLSQGGAWLSKGASVVGGYHEGGDGRQAGWSHYMLLSDGVGGDLETSEAFDALVGTPTVVLSRVGVDLLTFSDLFDAYRGMVLISGTISASYDGYYYIAGNLLIDRFDLEYPDGAAVSFPAGIGGQIQIMFPAVTSLLGDWVQAASSYIDTESHYLAFPRYANGQVINCSGDPVDPGRTFFQSFRNSEDGKKNRFAEMYYGRFLMRGGGSSQIGYNWRDEIVSGHAQITVDKIDDRHFSSGHKPEENAQEWGFDYRGAHFAKSTSDDVAGHQLGQSVRLPMWWYDSGADEYTIEENFTVFSATTLTFSSGTFDNTNMPFDASVFPNGILAEIEFDSPDESDSGLYFCYDKPTTARIEFKTVNGGSPSFNGGATGKARFYGGVVAGSVDTSNMTSMADSFMLNLVSPNMKMGGVRYNHRADDAIGSTDLLYALWLVNVDSPMFSIRDGGVTFARAFTTKSPSAVGNLTQWDQIDSSLYTGDLTTFDEIELNEDSNIITLPTDIANANVIERKGGSSWTVTKAINIFKIVCNETAGGLLAWDSPTGSFHLAQQVADEAGKISFILPHGVTLNSIAVYVDPFTGDGTAASFGVEVWRKAHLSTTGQSLRSTGMLYASSAALHNLVVSVDQNNVIDNSEYTYWVQIRGSDSVGDLVYTMRGQYTTTKLGEHLFDCF
jgi:hypothetical protein